MMASPNTSRKCRKWCIVPGCCSTSTKTPDKVFLYVPYDTKKRKLWIAAARRNISEFGKSCTLYVCEDHFNLEEDMENYIKYKLMGGQKKLKPTVVPHIFDCQTDRKRAALKPPREASVKRSRQQLVQELLSSSSSTTENVEISIENVEVLTENIEISTENVFKENIEENPCTSGIQTYTTEKSTQTSSPPRVYYRSKYVQCNQPLLKNSACSPFKINKNSATSPFKSELSVSFVKKQVSVCFSEIESTSCSEIQTDSDFTTDCLLTSETDENVDIDVNEEIKKLSRDRILKLIPLQSRLYLGLPKDSFFIINLLLKYTSASVLDIYITLKKIRTGHTFAELSDDFGMSESNASRIFGKTVTKLSRNLSTLIIWPTKQIIKQMLPIAFIANYSKVQSIIDCLEIEIEKPSNSLHQSLTWSDYKQANTIKYLVSATPNGIINFISTGYGGRASDALIVQESGFLNKVPSGTAIMADRGFKHVEHLLKQKQCSLIRPPSVDKNRKSSKAEVLETKRIASLRIHIERVIRRLREFKMLKPHACVSISLLKYIDHIIVIACGLANLQDCLIKR